MAIVKRQSKNSIDWLATSIFFSIVLVGWLMLYTYSYDDSSTKWIDFNSVVGKQTIWIGVAFLAFLVFISLDWRTWSSLAYPIYTCLLYTSDAADE